MANVELSVPATPESVYEIASVSKQFTATAIMLLVEDGKLGLDDPIARRTCRKLLKTWQAVRVRNLLNHTSGIKDYLNTKDISFRKDYSDDELVAMVAGPRARLLPRREVGLLEHQLPAAREVDRQGERPGPRRLPRRAHLRAAGDEVVPGQRHARGHPPPRHRLRALRRDLPHPRLRQSDPVGDRRRRGRHHGPRPGPLGRGARPGDPAQAGESRADVDARQLKDGTTMHYGFDGRSARTRGTRSSSTAAGSPASTRTSRDTRTTSSR